mmetsp:Transcript_10554/g.32295  ORF Transcript_10554/g.32295 Transcript_10554/m.32295 type:complete len:349 (+) Transcript_10554:163-1209(+)
MASLSRTGGKVGGMLGVRPPLPPGHGAMLRIPASRSSESTSELARGYHSASPLKGSRSYDSGLSVARWSSATNSPASSISQSASVDESLSAMLKGEAFNMVGGQQRQTGPSPLVPTDMQYVRQQAKECIDRGKLAPDEVVFRLLWDRLAQRDCKQYGWLLDGFPRTPQQVDTLADNDALPDVVIVMEVDDEDLIDRLENRRIDPDTNEIYNLKYKKPASEEVRQRLVTREDDRREVIKKRLATYRNNMPGIMANFADHDVDVFTVDAGDGVSRDELHKEIYSTLMERSNSSDHEYGAAPSLKPLRVAITGPPGCGKGTQAHLLRKDIGLVHISTGDLLRESVQALKSS